MCVGRWQGRVSLDFRSASALISDEYGNTVDYRVPAVCSSSVSGVVEDEEIWNLGDTLLSENADVRRSPHVEFIVIGTRRCELSIAVPDKTGDVFRMSFRVLMCCKSRKRLGCRSRHWRQVDQSCSQ